MSIKPIEEEDESIELDTFNESDAAALDDLEIDHERPVLTKTSREYMLCRPIIYLMFCFMFLAFGYKMGQVEKELNQVKTYSQAPTLSPTNSEGRESLFPTNSPLYPTPLPTTTLDPTSSPTTKTTIS